MHWNAVPRLAISAIWDSWASNSAFFLWECMFPGRKGSFIHGNKTSESEFGQDNGLTRNTSAAKLKGAHRFLLGPRDIYHSHYLKITL